MELKRFNIEEELSSIRFSCADEAIGEIKNLFFQDQLSEEKILLEIYSPNGGEFTKVDLNRLNIDRVYSKNQLIKSYLFQRRKLVDSVKFQEEYSIKTILRIKNEQRRLNAEFKSFYILIPSKSIFKRKGEPLLFAKVGGEIYYLLNDYWLEEQKSKKNTYQNIFNWIKKGISTKMFFK